MSTQAPTKVDWYSILKFKLHQKVNYKGTQYTIVGWSSNGDGDKNTGIGTSFKYKLDNLPNFVQEKELLAELAKAAAETALAKAEAETPSS
jgi:hypothetical protein